MWCHCYCYVFSVHLRRNDKQSSVLLMGGFIFNTFTRAIRTTHDYMTMRSSKVTMFYVCNSI